MTLGSTVLAWGDLKGKLTGDTPVEANKTKGQKPMEIVFLNHDPAPGEMEAYRAHAMLSEPTALRVLIDMDGDDAVLTYEMPRVPFERIRRITGYLQITGQWNNAKKAELHDRVMHGLANQCVACGAEMPEGDQVCRLCREGAKNG
jgi:hypothetical protein